MKREEAAKLTENAIADLAAALEGGHSETLINFLAAMSRFHNYSFGNIMLIASQKPEATHVAGFNTWKKLGRFVRKGEKGIAILAPLVYRHKEEDVQYDNDDSEKQLRGFKVVHVFDVLQTDGNEVPEFATVKGNPGQHVEQLKSVIAKRNIGIEHEHIVGGALGVSRGGSIVLCPDLEPAQEFSVLVHEFAHELLHHGTDRNGSTKTTRETEAEAVAFVVCHAVGLDTNTAASDYIQLYKGSKETLAQSLDRIQQTAAEIICGLKPDPA